jgi:hypothetical protein
VGVEVAGTHGVWQGEMAYEGWKRCECYVDAANEIVASCEEGVTERRWCCARTACFCFWVTERRRCRCPCASLPAVGSIRARPLQLHRHVAVASAVFGARVEPQLLRPRSTHPLPLQVPNPCWKDHLHLRAPHSLRCPRCSRVWRPRPLVAPLSSAFWPPSLHAGEQLLPKIAYKGGLS